MRAKSLFFGLAFLLSGSCANDDFPEYIELKGLRILALQAGATGAPSEYSPGDSVTITPIISDYYGAGRPLNYEAFACIDPGISVGVEPSCTGVPGAVSVGSGVATAPALERTGITTTFSVNIPSTVLDQRGPADKYNGVNYLVTYKLTAGTEVVQAFRRILVSENSKTSKNNNPQTTAILANGAPLTSLPTGAVELSVSYPAGSVETYSSKKSDLSLVSATESLVTTWFRTDGELKFYRTIDGGTNKYTPPPTAPAGRQALLIAVTRDDRGGVTYLIQGFRVGCL